MREYYLSEIFQRNDFLFHIGNYDNVIVSAMPEKMLNYATIFKPYDLYTWIFAGVSVLEVTVTMVAIETTSSAWIGNSGRISFHQCNDTYMP